MKTFLITLTAGLFALMGAASFAQALNDGKIAEVVVAANKVDIEAANLAMSKALSKDVKTFAEHMIADHTGSFDRASALVTKLNVALQTNEIGAKLKNDGEISRDKLEKLSGAAFDKAYIDNEVTFHQTVLDTIDKTLIPNAKNAELKDLLDKTRPVINDHLQMAKKLQASMK